MHPHDQYLAFAWLHDEGQPAADIAARFGVSERIVGQRLKLGRVAPALLVAYRDGAMTLDTLMAFTVSDDHGEQERVWSGLPTWNRQPEIIRRHLTTAHLAAGDRVARFVGIDAYEAAGGTVLRDLFDDTRCWLTDPALAHQLAAERLEAEAATLRDAGWRWVLVGIERPLLQPAGRVYATHREPAETEQAEMDRLGGRLAEIEAVMASEGLDEADGSRLTAEQEELEAALASLHAGLSGFTDEDKARAGCLVYIDPYGDLAALPAVRLGRWQHRILGPAPTPELVGLDPTQHLARVREMRRLEQLHYDRSWLLIGIVALFAVFDLYTGPGKGSSHLAFPVSLGIALLLQAFANQRIGWYTDRIAIDVAKSLPSRGPVIPPLRRASPAALTGIGIVALASIAALRG